MKIAVCDDTLKDLETTRKYIEEYANKKKTMIETSFFNHPDDLLNDIKKTNYDIYILDIIMPMFNGIEIGKEIRKIDTLASIIYVTTSHEYAINAFTVHALDYLVKPYTYENLEAALNRVIINQDTIIVPTKDGVIKINLIDICFIESNNNYLFLHLTSDEIIKVRMTLSMINEKLIHCDEFSMLGSSYIVNFLHIAKITNNIVKLDNGEELLIPRRVIKEFTSVYFNYYTKETMK